MRSTASCAKSSRIPAAPGAGGEGARPVEFGLIAEEVAEIYPDLVVYDEEGEPYSVRYHVLAPMLLNELQRLQREFAALETRNRELEALGARVGRLESMAAGDPGVATAQR